MYRVELTCDHLLFPIDATCLRNAVILDSAKAFKILAGSLDEVHVCQHLQNYLWFRQGHHHNVSTETLDPRQYVRDFPALLYCPVFPLFVVPLPSQEFG